MRPIDADALYEKLKNDEDLARQRVIDTPTSFLDGSLNPASIRYMAQLSEITRLKEIVYDMLTIEPEPRPEPDKGDRQALIDTTPEGVTPKLLTNHEAIKILRSIAKIAKPFMRNHLQHATAIALDKAESALMFAEVMSRSHTCNNCGQKDCGYKPEWGEQVRYNCFWWKEGHHEGDL